MSLAMNARCYSCLVFDTGTAVQPTGSVFLTDCLKTADLALFLNAICVMWAIP